MKNIKRRMILAIAGVLGLACSSLSSGSIIKTSVSSYNAANVQIETHQGITYINNQVANGVVYLLDAHNDTLLFENYTNGKLDGDVFSRYENLRFAYRHHFVNGKMEGAQQSWWENGNAKQEANYKNDVFDGSLKEWSESGMLTRENHYVDGHEEGKQRLWYDNGKLRANYIVKNGRTYGLTGTMNCYNVVEQTKNKKN